MARYNAKGEEKTSPFVYCRGSKYITEINMTEIPNNLRQAGNVKIDIYPCEDFRFMAAKDDDFNIDIYIHANPKHLVKNIPRVFRNIKSVATM